MRRKSLVCNQKDAPEHIFPKAAPPRQTVDCHIVVLKNIWYKIFILLFLLLLFSLLYHEKRKDESNEGVQTAEIRKALLLQKEWNGMEKFEKRKIILIYSTWRSGSSFVGGIFESNPGMMYIYEPFQDIGIKIVRFVS